MSTNDQKQTTRKRLAIIGAGDLGYCLLRITKDIPSLTTVGFFDDTCSAKTVHGLTVLGKIDAIVPLWERQVFDAIVIAIGYKHMKFRRELFEQLQSRKIPFQSVIHPSSVIAEAAVVGSGSILFPGCILDVGARIGNNCVLNSGVTIAHDSRIDDHSICGPRVTLSGLTHVHHSCFLGTATTLIDNISVQPGIFTGAGAVVTENLSDPCLYVGVPARPLKPLSE